MKSKYCWQLQDVILEGDQLPAEMLSPENSLLETIAVHAGKPIWLEKHLTRICNAASDRWGVEFKPAELSPHFLEAIDYEEGRLRCLLFADGSSCWIFQEEQLSCNPLTVILLEVAQPLGCYKTGDRLRHAELLARARSRGADEALLVLQGELLEGTYTNIVIHDQSGWWTPPLDGRILPGIMRDLLLQHLYDRSEKVQEGIVTVERLQQCDRLLLCNSLRGIIPVKELIIPGDATVSFPTN